MSKFSFVNNDQSLLLPDYPLAKHTSWRMGGPADWCYWPHRIHDLQNFLSQLSCDQPLTWLGLGSNVLIRDGGIQGFVIITHQGLSRWHLSTSGLVRCEAGVPCAKLARVCRDNSLNAVFLTGIPGTVGGALAMNAGAFGSETWQYVMQVETIDRYGRLHLRKPEDFRIGYRCVQRPDDEWFVAGYFKFPFKEREDIVRSMRNMLQQRSQRQPVKLLSCGSVFCNPPGDFAGRLIEHCGLKGYQIGGAQVSMQHANFIINTGAGTAADVERLIHHIIQCVQARTDVILKPEVKILGRCLAQRR